MKFFISKMDDYSVVNNKGLALQKWLKDFGHKLLPDELSKDAFIEEVHQKIADLDKQFPRSGLLTLSRTSIDNGLSLYVSIYPIKNPEKTVVRFYIHKVIGDYRFNEKVSIDSQKGGLK